MYVGQYKQQYKYAETKYLLSLWDNYITAGTSANMNNHSVQE